jgi:mannose-1-phosphate guanylyltransferase
MTGCLMLERDPEQDRPERPLTAPRPSGWTGPPEPPVWVVVLAGGEGRRVQEFTTLRDGVVVPKQFCRFRDDRTLLAATIDRALAITSREHVLVVVLDSHREWWESELSRLPAANALSQPAGRGTATAILHALVQIHLRDRSPRIVVMPSDHDFDNESVVLGAVARATRTARLFPEDLVLLGFAPTHLDSDYGLILPGPGASGTSRQVRAFIEKPSLTTAAQLIRSGAMWNSFIFASTGAALYGAYEHALPTLARTYLRGLVGFGTDPDMLHAMFERLPEYDFCRDVLQRDPGRLRLIAVPPCGWTDLGSPSRLASWLERHREAPFWRDHALPRLSGPDGFAGALQLGGA